jgi:hypothetical protein
MQPIEVEVEPRSVVMVYPPKASPYLEEFVH